MDSHISMLWMKGCQLFWKFVCDVTNHKSFGLGLTPVDEIRKDIVFYLTIKYLIQLQL